MKLLCLIRTSLLLLILVLPLVVFGEEQEGMGGGLFPVKIGDNWGYVDKAGKIVIKPQFDGAQRFSEGLAMVEFVAQQGEGWKYGFIDASGVFVINPQYDNAESFSDGVARVGKNIGSGYYDEEDWWVPPSLDWSYIDQTGSPTRKPERDITDNPGVKDKFKFVGKLSEGLAPAQFNDGRWGFIDPTGQVVIMPQFSNAHAFSEGLALVETKQGDDYIYGYVDKSGTFIIAAKFSPAGDFSEGLADVCVGKGEKFSCGFVDKSGNFVINPSFHSVKSFYQGLAAAQLVDGGRWGYIDKSGKFVIEPQFDGAE